MLTDYHRRTNRRGIRTHLRITEHLHAAAHAVAADGGVGLADVVNLALAEYLRAHAPHTLDETPNNSV